MSFEEEESSAPLNILPALFRYKWALAVAIPVLLVVTMFVVLIIPSVYTSQGKIMVETQQIPTDLVKSTVTSAASEQIDVMKQRVMTRVNLLNIIEKYDYFNVTKNSPPNEINRVIREFVGNIGIELKTVRRGRQTDAIGFVVSFSSASPSIASSVANDLVTLFLSENVAARTKRASETTDFLKAEAEKIRKELDTIEKLVIEFKRENKDALPEHLTLYSEMANSSRELVLDYDREISSFKEKLNTFNNQLALLKEQSIVSSDDGAIQDISLLREEYKKLLLIYQPSHPDVKNLENQIKILENQGTSVTDQETVLSDAELNLNGQIKSLEAEIDLVEKQKRNEQENLKNLEERIIKIPQVEQGFTAINRDYEVKQEQYNSIIEKMQSAEMAESLEQERKAERFTILEPPLLPTEPSKPNRLILAVLAFGFSFGFPLGVVLMIGILDRTIRSSDALERVAGVQPLVEIPFIETEKEIKKTKKIIFVTVMGVIVAILFSLVLLHFSYMSLDVLLSKVIGRFGL